MNGEVSSLNIIIIAMIGTLTFACLVPAPHWQAIWHRFDSFLMEHAVDAMLPPPEGGGGEMLRSLHMKGRRRCCWFMFSLECKDDASVGFYVEFSLSW